MPRHGQTQIERTAIGVAAQVEGAVLQLARLAALQPLHDDVARMSFCIASWAAPNGASALRMLPGHARISRPQYGNNVIKAISVPAPVEALMRMTLRGAA